MMARHSTDANLSEHGASVLQRREQHGWFVNRIAEDGSGPGFAYSFGLFEEFAHPEVIVFGLAGETMHRLINLVGRQVRNGAKYAAGDQTSDLLNGYTCAFKRWTRSNIARPVRGPCGFTRAIDFPPSNCFGRISGTGFHGNRDSMSNSASDNQT
jgi:hypothetical protein